jgi:hypothetical protein
MFPGGGEQRPFPSILEKCDKLLKLNISTNMLLTLSRSWNTEFEKRNDVISILQEQLFSQCYALRVTSKCMLKQFDEQLLKQRKVLCVYISVISTSVGSPRLSN